jgi:pantothenate kinase type III
VILADCGNTAVKLGQGAERVRLAPAEVAAWLGSHPADQLVLLPGAAASAGVVRAAWGGRLREVGRDLALPDLGQYPGMGLDRIVAGLAAGTGTIVVDAGTATTLTAWGAGGRFAGGLILPGPHAMIAGLCGRAPALPLVEPLAATAAAAQRDTCSAIAAGAGIGHAMMVAGCIERLRRETGIASVLVTGGGAAGLGLPGAAWRPWLVLEGLEQLSTGR